jgi:hypothetical protein
MLFSIFLEYYTGIVPAKAEGIAQASPYGATLCLVESEV